jgi:GNAT superfamily N-acetyltransferase
LSFIQYLTYQDGIRAQIEAVKIRKDKRGLGIGKTMFEWAISRAQKGMSIYYNSRLIKKGQRQLNFTRI